MCHIKRTLYPNFCLFPLPSLVISLWIYSFHRCNKPVCHFFYKTAWDCGIRLCKICNGIWMVTATRIHSDCHFGVIIAIAAPYLDRRCVNVAKCARKMHKLQTALVSTIQLHQLHLPGLRLLAVNYLLYSFVLFIKLQTIKLNLRRSRIVQRFGYSLYKIKNWQGHDMMHPSI